MTELFELITYDSFRDIAIVLYIGGSIFVKWKYKNTVNLLEEIKQDYSNLKQVLAIMRTELTHLTAWVDKLQKKSDNNIQSLFNQVLRDYHLELENITPAEQGLWRYFQECIVDLEKAYELIKIENIDIMKTTAFKSMILTNATSDLNHQFMEVVKGKTITYPLVFTKYVDKVQKVLYQEATEKILIKLKETPVDDYLEVIKENIATVFSKFMSMVIKKFHSTKHLIGKDDLVQDMEKTHIKELLQNDYIPEALKSMIAYYSDNEKVSDLITVIYSDYNRTKRQDLIGLQKEKELVRITNSLLNILNEY